MVPEFERRHAHYHPQLPEQQSTLSRCIVRAEVALTVVIAVAVLLYIKPPKQRASADFTGIPTMMAPVAFPSAAGAADFAEDGAADAAKGQVLFMQTCTSCHGTAGQGMPHMGLNLRQSKFVASTSDLKLIAFLKFGRRPTDPKNTTGVPMPPRGGNLALDDDSLANIVAFLRQVQKQPPKD